MEAAGMEAAGMEAAGMVAAGMVAVGVVAGAGEGVGGPDMAGAGAAVIILIGAGVAVTGVAAGAGAAAAGAAVAGVVVGTAAVGTAAVTGTSRTWLTNHTKRLRISGVTRTGAGFLSCRAGPVLRASEGRRIVGPAPLVAEFWNWTKPRRSFTRLAEGVGFEPTVRFPVRLISSQVILRVEMTPPRQARAVKNP
jgi:hypothetical protein